MSVKTQIALMGAGLIGREHATLLKAHPGVAFVGIADPSEASVAYAREIGVPHFADYIAMLDEAKPEGVIVALPNQLHVPAGMACIERGIACLMEKPVADTVAAALAFAAASETADVPVLVGHHRRHSPDMREARRIVQEGLLGDLVAVNGMCLFDKPANYFDTAWRREPGGGPILINLIHEIDALRFICGEIESVRAFSSNAVRGFAVEDTTSVSIRFVNGALGTYMLSDVTPSPWAWEFASNQALYFPHQPGAYLFLAGRKASLSVSDMQMWRHEKPEEHWQHPLVRHYRPTARTSAYVNQLDHFLAVTRREAKPLLDARDGTSTLAATLAVTRAAEEGRTVTLAEMLAG